MKWKWSINIPYLYFNTYKDAEFNEEHIYDQLEDDLNSALELMKTSGEKAHLEQKTKTGRTNENTIMEDEANKKMRGLKKMASTQMKRRMRNIGKDQKLQEALNDLENLGTVKAQFFCTLYTTLFIREDRF